MRRVAAAALAGLALASCGGGEDAEQSAPESGAAAPRVAAAQGAGGAETGDASVRERKAGAPEKPPPKEQAPGRSPPARQGSGNDGAGSNAATKRLLRALAPSSDDTGDPHQATDPASRRLWALVQRRLGEAEAADPASAAPTSEALRRLLREAQRRQGG